MSKQIPIGYNPAAAGCTEPDCRSQDTTVLDPLKGRRCALHAPTFDREWAGLLVDLGRASEAFTYLRSWLAHKARSA